MSRSSYPTAWSQSAQVPIPHIPASGPAYPATTIPADPFQKMPLSGTPSFSAESQDISLQQTTVPSVQLSLQAQDGHQAPLRTQYAAFVHGTSAPPPLPITTTADSSLSMPRYVDSNPRPSKSPRRASHQSVHSTGSISNDTASNEYRFGPPYGALSSNNTSEMSPQPQHPPTYGAPAPAPESNSGPPSAATTTPHQRDYFPPSQSWTTTTGETAAPSTSYPNGGTRSYAFPDHYKTGHGGTKPDLPHLPHHPASGVYPSHQITPYQWSAT
jgi:hypothetical protein